MGDKVETGRAAHSARSGVLTEGLYYLLLIALTVAILFATLQLWRADLGVPFSYISDTFFTQTIVRGLLDNGTFWTNPALGLPGRLEMYDFAGSDGAHYALLWLLGKLLGGAIAAVNAYYLLGFPLAAVAAFWALRRMRLSVPASMLAALLFAFQPYHFSRGEAHLFLGAYYAVPLAAYYCYEAGRGGLRLLGRENGRWFFERRELIVAAVVAAIVASSGVYYAFFACFLLVVGGVIGWLRVRDRAVVWSWAALIVAIVIVGLLNLSPALSYKAQHGSNDSFGGRNPGAAEVYGLKIDQLLLPADGHRVPVFARLKQMYRDGLTQMGPYMNNEAASGSLGVIGSVGFVVLLGIAVLSAGGVAMRAGPGPDLTALSSLTLASVLLGTVGGFGALVAVVLPEVRSYNRISIFIAFFALAAVALFAERLAARFGTRQQLVLWVASGLIVLLGVWDQATPAFVPGYEALNEIWQSDRSFVAEVEGLLAEDAAVFQLPYMPWPEPGGPFGEMGDYDPFRAYLASSGGLRFSYGAMKGREADAAQRELAELPPEQLVPALKRAGFSAIWVDLGAFEDDQAVLDALRSSAGQEIASGDGRFAVFVLR